MTQPSRTADTDRAAENTPVRVLGVLAAVAFAVLLVLAGVDPWWMLPLAAAAAPLGLSDRGAQLGAVAMAVAIAAGAFAVLVGWADLRDVLVTAARGVVTGVLPWSVAMAWRARRAGEADAALALLREQEAQQMRAEADLARQRLHLAESLHDDLGHALSLVAVNLGRLELELERDPETQRGSGTPTAVRESVGLARRQVSDAVTRLGASVQSLRAGLAGGTPGVQTEAVQASLDALVRDARRAGADVEVTGSPDHNRLAAFGPTLVRVVREGLTNALKHAPGQTVRVALDAGTERLVVTMRNPLPEPLEGAPSAAENAPAVGGTGVRTLTEHVRVAGGSVEAGPTNGEYVLRAELRPVDRAAKGAVTNPITGSPPTAFQATARDAAGHAADVEHSASGSDGSRDAREVTHGLVRARRRGGALLLAAVLVPAAALVVVSAAIQLADHLDARRAQLDQGAFARISVGDSRFDVQPLLPAATLEPPPGADPSCDYYAVTADPLADASGDAYRICWADGHVVSTDILVGGAR